MGAPVTRVVRTKPKPEDRWPPGKEQSQAGPWPQSESAGASLGGMGSASQRPEGVSCTSSGLSL